MTNKTGTYDVLDALIAQSAKFDQLKSDHQVKAADLTFNEKCWLKFQREFPHESAEPLKLTDLALVELLSKLSPTVFGPSSKRSIPYDYLSALPDDLRADVLRRHCADTGDAKWMVRAYDNTCRAILSPKYPGGIDEQGRFENTQFLSILKDLLPKNAPSDFHLVRPVLNPDVMIVRSIAKMDDQGGYGIGVAISNSEVGNRKLRAHPLVKRTSCDNSIMVDRDGMSLEISHFGSLAAMRVQFKAIVGQALKASAELLNKVIEAEEHELEDIDAILRGICDEQGWKNGLSAAIHQGTENSPTVMGVVNGITWASHTVPGLDPFLALDMESFAGSLLYTEAKEWRRLLAHGEQVRERELVAVR